MKAVFFDIDGTLVDSNGFHVEAWAQVFADAGHAIARDRIAGQIGKGTDQLVPTLLPGTPEDEEQALGDAHGRNFKSDYLDQVRPFAGAHDIIARAHDEGLTVGLASSASQEELDHYLDLLAIRDLVDVTTTIDNVAHSKPAPDIFAVAAKKAGVALSDVVVIGDAPYDMAAARKCGMRRIAVRSGGFDDAALREAGAQAIYDDVAELLQRWDETVLARAESVA